MNLESTGRCNPLTEHVAKPTKNDPLSGTKKRIAQRWYSVEPDPLGRSSVPPPTGLDGYMPFTHTVKCTDNVNFAAAEGNEKQPFTRCRQGAARSDLIRN